MHVAVDDIIEMLLKRAPIGNVEQLEATADTENWHVPIERATQQAELCGIAALVGRIVGRVRLRAVRARTDVTTPDEDQAINRVERLVDETIHLG